MTRDGKSLDETTDWADLQQRSHDLALLEERLHQALRAGTVTKSAFEARLKPLLVVKKKLQDLRRLEHEKRRIDMDTSEFGLPGTDLLIDTDWRLVNEVLDRRLLLLKHCFKDMKLLKTWVDDASKGEASGFRGTWRLSKFKKTIALHKQQEAVIDEQLKSQSLYIGKINTKLTDIGKQEGRDSFASLRLLFAQIHQATLKMNKIKAAIYNDRLLIYRMTAWLQGRPPSSAAFQAQLPSYLKIRMPPRRRWSEGVIDYLRRFFFLGPAK